VTPQQQWVSLVAYGVVLLSLLVQGGLITPVTRVVKIEKPA
jgi:NhaP-type Na+/H+ or K+/H+ antiporter